MVTLSVSDFPLSLCWSKSIVGGVTVTVSEGGTAVGGKSCTIALGDVVNITVGCPPTVVGAPKTALGLKVINLLTIVKMKMTEIRFALMLTATVMIIAILEKKEMTASRLTVMMIILKLIPARLRFAMIRWITIVMEKLTKDARVAIR